MNHDCSTIFRAVVWVIGSMALVSPAFGADASVGNCDPPNVKVRGKWKVTNNTGQTADDFHFYMYQNDRPSVQVTGAQAGCSAFGSASVSTSNDNGTGNPPPGDHGANVDFSGGSVPPGGTIDIDLALCMNEQNCVKIKDVEWTFTASGDPPAPGPRPRGFRVHRPFPGGNGGNHTPSGGGWGAQEGNGGGGNWIHRVCIENDTDDDVLLAELKLLASTTFYADLESIDWASIAPVQNANGEPPVIIPAHGSWCFDFQTTGPYLGGHIYLHYSLATAFPPVFADGSDGPAVTDDTDETELFGDHPPDAINTDVLEGDDYWQTVDCAFTYGQSLPPIPADFFGPGSLPFEGTVFFTGIPVDPATSNADTIVRRLEPALFQDGPIETVPIEIVALNLVSIQPIEVHSLNDPPRFFDAYVTFSSESSFSFGDMTIQTNLLDGGTFTSQIQVAPLLTFAEVPGGNFYVLSEGHTLGMDQSNPNPWAYAPPPCPVPGSGPDFFPFEPPPLNWQHFDGTYQTVVPATPSSAPVPADFDDDGDVDLVDFLHFQLCFSGPNIPYTPGCEDADLDGDGDGDVDLVDFLEFQACFGGPDNPPACDPCSVGST